MGIRLHAAYFLGLIAGRLLLCFFVVLVRFQPASCTCMSSGNTPFGALAAFSGSDQFP